MSDRDDRLDEIIDAVLLARIEPGSVLDQATFAARCRANPEQASVAIQELQRLGLATIVGRHVHISPCNVGDVLSHVERRRMLEVLIVRNAALNASDGQLAAMKTSEALQNRCALIGDLDGLMRAERELERLMVEASGLHDEGAELVRIKVEFRRAWCAANRLRTFTQVANIRTALVAALAARDPDAAEAQVHVFFEHLLKSY